MTPEDFDTFGQFMDLPSLELSMEDELEEQEREYMLDNEMTCE